MTTLDARAFWITGDGHGEIRREAIDPPGPGELLIETLYSGISRGTETLVFRERVPPSEHERMRAPFQAGDFPAPVKYGYVNVGRVAGGDAELDGAVVFSLYPHQTRFVVPAAAVTVVPEAVPPGRAVLAANLETAVNGLWDAAPAIGDRLAVVGAGTIGCLAAWLAAGLPGTEVELIDVDVRKAEIAVALGVPFRRPADARPDADLVVHASGSPGGLATALALAGFEATVLELSWYGAGDVGAPLGERFHSRRLKLVSSQVGAVAARQRARWGHARRMALVMRLLESPALDALVTGESAFDELPAIMPRIASGELGALCHRITYL